MKPVLTDIEHRRPVWNALSSLFLDTEVDDSLLKHIAETCRTSPYSWDECEEILWSEVYPVCIPNMLVVAGEWVCFDEEWLEHSILHRAELFQRFPWKLFRWTHRRKYRLCRGMISEEWERVRLLYE